MKSNYREKLTLLAMILAAFGSVTTLHADASPKAKADQNTPVLSPLEEARNRLKAAAKNVEDPEVLKLVKVALQRASFVAKGGPDVTPERAQKALSSVQQVLAVINKKKSGLSSHHVSSSKSCDARKEISEIESEFEECCEDIQRELTEVLQFVNTQLPCDEMLPICSVPVVLSEPGKYCVNCDLVYNGSAAAILVTADNVSINFHNHSLTLTDSNAQGILVKDVNEFTLENDIIQGSSIFKSATSAAVHLENVNKATLKNIYTKNTTKGIAIENSADVRVEYSRVEAHEGTVQVTFPSPATLAGTGNGAGIWIDGSHGVAVDSCAFVGADLVFDPARTSFGLHIEGDSKNITLKHSTFTDWLGSIHALNVDGLLVDHCIAIASPVSNLNVVQLGSCSQETKANDVIIRNSNFVYSGDRPGFDGLFLAGGSGCVLENLVVDTQSDLINANSVVYYPAGIHVGLQGCDSFENVVARNCIVKGHNYIGVHLENSHKATFEDCQISDAIEYNVFMNDPTTNAHLKDSTVSSGEKYGVYLNTQNGGSNSVENCQIYLNGDYGLTDSVTPVTENLFLHNNVYANGSGIYVDSSGMTMTFFNTSCNNTSDNCFSTYVSPSQLPGDTPAVSGTNVCCQNP